MHPSEVEDLYLYVNRDCGSVSGLWPYGNKQRKRICRFLMIFVAITSLITQIARVITIRSVDSLIEQCPFLVIAVGIIIKESNYIIHEEQLRSVFGFLFKDWMMERPKDEFDIMDKYARRGLFFSRLYVANGYFCYIIFTLVAIRPRLLDIIAPRNESRGVDFIYPAYYGLDEEKHYYIILAHMLSVITVVFFVYISCDSIYITIIQHACGLLNVTGYRFMSAIQDTDRSGDAKVAEEEYRRVCFSVKAHQHAMEYIGMIERMHEKYLFIVVTLVILTFSITLVKASMMEPSVEFYKYCGFVVVQLVHLLFLSIQGYFIIMAHDNVYSNIYNGLWYLSTAKTQELYAFALRRNLTPPLLTAGGIMTLNLESFSEILKASVSYFTVLKSS